MGRLKEAIKGALNWAGFGLLSFALLAILGPCIPTAAIAAVTGIANVAIGALTSAPALTAAAGLGFFGATAGFFHEDIKK